MAFGDNQSPLGMRAYVFINAILRPVQQGIQGGHALVEMATRYHDWKGDKRIAEMFWQWATKHRTAIFCSAGFHRGVMDWHDFIMKRHHLYPRAAFREDGETLGGLYTAIAIVIPEFIYTAADLVRRGETYWPDGVQWQTGLTQFEQELVERLARAKLAS